MKHLLATAALLLVIATSGFAQTSYNDVLVLVNSNSPISINVGSYFRAQRGIPAVNVCSIAMPTTEEITGAQFSSIAATVSNYLTSTGLTASISYIVTTQGVPLKVRRDSSVFNPYSDASSFDSELCLLQSAKEIQIGQAGPSSNPYYAKWAKFSRTATYSNVRLVTRLAGYSYSDITALIDRATQPYHSAGTFVFDQDPSKASTFAFLLNDMKNASDSASLRGFNALLNTTSTFVNGMNEVLGYVSFGSNDAYWQTSGTWKARPNFTFSAKALAETYVSSSGRSFSDSTFNEPTIGWQSMVADLIAGQGVTGVKGYVYEPYSTAMARVNILFGRWTGGFNLAESYYAASARMGWMDVIIGDPKATLAGNGHLPVELVSFGGTYRNSEITLVWKTATESNNHGFDVQKRAEDGSWTSIGFVAGSGTSNTPRNYSITDRTPMPANTYRLRQIDRDGVESFSRVIEVAGSPVGSFALAQNYPNPFNPSTAIACTLPVESNVSLMIYSIDGRLVRTLAQRDLLSAGAHAYTWDGATQDGASAASGMYICRMTAEVDGQVAFTATRSMTLAR